MLDIFLILIWFLGFALVPTRGSEEDGLATGGGETATAAGRERVGNTPALLDDMAGERREREA
jgi:hypothetical protein